MVFRATVLLFLCVVGVGTARLTSGVILATAIPDTSFNTTGSGLVSFRESPLEEVGMATSSTQANSSADTAYDSMIFVGDIMLARHVEQLIEERGVSYPFEGISLSSFSERPAVIGNFESSMCEPHIRTPFYTMRFSTAQTALSGLKEARFTHLSLANNHSFDCGVEGYHRTWKSLSEIALQPFGSQVSVGAESIRLVHTPHGVFALIGIHLVHVHPGVERLTALFEAVNNISDYQIVYVHWGDEYQVRHAKKQRNQAELFVSLGADMIVGHHPHVVQGIEIINGTPVFYSLGNYIFDQYFSDEVQTGLVLEVVFSASGHQVVLHPVSSVGIKAQPRLLLGEEKAAFLGSLAERSDKTITDQITTGQVRFNPSVASSTKIAIMDR